MSLQVYSPHSHNQSSNDPQSPYPCTPSTLCSSPLTQSGSGGSGGNSTSNQSSYFRASHHHHHFVLREDSLPSIASSSTHDQHDIDREPAQEEEDDRIAQNYYHHRNTHARNKSSATLDSPEMPLSIRSPSMSTLGGGGTPDRTSPHGTVNKNRFRSEMKTYPSAASIPIILAGLNGLKQTERGGLELDHGKERSENSDVCRDSPNERSTVMKSDQEEESEQRGSVGLGLGILQDPIELIQVVPTRHASQCTRMSPFHAFSTDADEMQSTIQLQASLHAENAEHDLTAPRQDRADSWTSSLVSTGDESINSSSSSSSNPQISTPNVSPPSFSSIPLSSKLLPPHDGYAQGMSNNKQTLCYGVPEQHRNTTSDILASPLSIRNSLKLANVEENVDSPSQASEFSISAYDYSPHIPQQEEGSLQQKQQQQQQQSRKQQQQQQEDRSRWSNHAIEIQPIRLCDHNNARSRVSSFTSFPDSKEVNGDQKATTSNQEKVGNGKKKKKKQHQNLTASSSVTLDETQTKKEIKGRKRAVTLANPAESNNEARKDLRRQSSPPLLSTASKFVDQYATLSHGRGRTRPTTANAYDYGSNAEGQSSSMTASPFADQSGLSRPHTASSAASGRLFTSPAALFKPLPSLPQDEPVPQSPIVYQQQQDQTLQSSKRPGFLSVQTSPRKANFSSRPGTASPAARSFGLVAPYANLSPTYRDYRSLKSRESFSSLINQSGGGSLTRTTTTSGNRSRSTSISSSISCGKKSYDKKNKQEKDKEKERILFDGPPKYIKFAIDQEGFREICPIFELVEAVPHHASLTSSSSSNATTITTTSNSSNGGTVNDNKPPTTCRYLPIHSDQAYPFHHSTMESPPILRRLLIVNKVAIDNDDGLNYDNLDFINKQSLLYIRNEGIYAVNGKSSKGDYNWRFEYKVIDRLNLIGKPIPGEKNLIPLGFTCHAGVLDPNNARKRKAIDVVVKTLTSKLEALRVGDLPLEGALT